MELKTEKSICEYLETLPDDTIIKYYLDVEYTPFPVLIIKEYQRRFKQKTKAQILKKLSYQASLAKKKSRELGLMARQNKLVNEVTRQKSEEIFRQAKRKGLKLSDVLSKKGLILGSKAKSAKTSLKKGIQTKVGPSAEDDLCILEKLGKLRKSGIITEKEFQAKKKKILQRI